MKSCLAGDGRLVYPVMEQLTSDKAVVTKISNLVLPEEAAYLLQRASGKFDRSKTTSEGSANKYDSSRTSTTAFLSKGEDEVVSCIEDRISTVANMPRTHLEPLQVTDYTHKQEYKFHHDYFNSNKDGKSDRTTTVFTYLHSEHLEDGKCGGSTVFADLKDKDGAQLRVYPKMGDAVMWSNRTLTGGVNPATLHSGEAVTCPNSRKTGLNAWFRDRKY